VITATASSANLGCNPIVIAPTFTGSDNCVGSFAPVVTTNGPSNIGCAYTQTWTANFTDPCQNAAVPVSITYTWTLDTTPPVITLTPGLGSGGLILPCQPVDFEVTFSSASATDNCGTATLAPGYPMDGPVVVVNVTTRSQTRTWRYIDGCGNASNESETLSWLIPTPLVPQGPNVTIALGCNPTQTMISSAIGPITPPAEDLLTGSFCGPVNVGSNDLQGQNGCNYFLVRTFTLTDPYNQQVVITRTVTWKVDVTAPVIECPQSHTIACDMPVVFGEPAAVDNCTAMPMVSVTGNSVSVNMAGDSIFVRTWTAVDSCGNMASCSQTITKQICPQMCMQSQGFYGNAGGTFCNTGTTTALMNSLLSSPIVMGGGANTHTIPANGATLLIARMPGGGGAAKLTGSSTLPGTGSIQIHNGRYKNSLLAQGITLELNLRLDAIHATGSLAGTRITGQYLVSRASSNCGSTTALPVGPAQTFVLPIKVVNYLNSWTNPANPGALPHNKISDLKDLVNRGLSGAYVPAGQQPSLSELVSTMTTLVDGYHSCRIMTGFFTTNPNAITVRYSGSSTAEGITINAYPNPFDQATTIEFSVPQAGRATVDVYDLNGKLVQRLFSAEAQAGVKYTAILNAGNMAQGMYYGRITVGEQTQYIKLMMIK
jgi:hypothetical protein